MRLVATSALVLSSLVVACAEPPAELGPTAQALATLHDQALPYYEQGHAGTFVGAAGVTIAYQAFTHPGARAAIVFAPGRGEGSHNFIPLAYDLRDQPYDLYIIDHRGQGASGRMLADPLKGHVDAFDNYVADYAQLIDEVVQPARYDHLFALAHSMGGAITVKYAMAHPTTFDALVLSAPMLEINLAPLSEDAALLYASHVAPDATLQVGGDGTTATVFAGNNLTNDAAELAVMNETEALFPDRRVGFPTYGWAAESIKADQYIRAHAELMTSPVRLFQAGGDRIVMTPAQTTFCAAAKDCQLTTFPLAQHELLYSEQPFRGTLMTSMLTFFGTFGAR
jgi:lysophospholipase